MIKDKQWSTKHYAQKIRSIRSPLNTDRTNRQQHNGQMTKDKEWSKKYYTQKIRSTTPPLNTDRTDRQQHNGKITKTNNGRQNIMHRKLDKHEFH